MPRLADLAGRSRRDREATDTAPLLLTPAMISDDGLTIRSDPMRAASGGSAAVTGDVLLTAVGEPAAAIVPRELAGAEVSDHLFILRGLDAETAAGLLRFRTHRGKAAVEGREAG